LSSRDLFPGPISGTANEWLIPVALMFESFGIPKSVET
jgi:hypothetical protein